MGSGLGVFDRGDGGDPRGDGAGETTAIRRHAGGALVLGGCDYGGSHFGIGYATAPEGPGLGIELDEAQIERLKRRGLTPAHYEGSSGSGSR